jgi:hypothetical protein
MLGGVGAAVSKDGGYAIPSPLETEKLRTISQQ